ncbi:hypothetical protein PDESU_02206 [Pontiella desulfatans]|uniref:Dockerin domain-containing protein n=2 Tax=Pontiella desulfatans TaxID=2750659 RepID=A0A6C2U1G4_PONDE|nr:hypothetical protein PDESU_02206 [Pontiella desulfatans]
MKSIFKWMVIGLALAGNALFAAEPMQITVCPRLTPNALGETNFVRQVEELFIHQLDEWSAVLENISHFKFYSTPVVWLNKREPALLSQSVANLAAMGKDFAVEVGIRKGHESTEEGILDPITAAGGTVDFIITDNVFVKSQFKASTTNIYNWTYEDAVTNYATYVAGIKENYPDLKVGILEAAFRFHWEDQAIFPAEDPSKDYGDLKTILVDVIAACDALGTKIDIFQPEYSYERIVNTENGWAKLQAMEAFCEQQGLEFYFLFNDHTGGNTSDQLFHENVMNCLREVKANGLTPALGTVQSWYDHPVAILPEDQPYTFMYLANAFIRESVSTWTWSGTEFAEWDFNSTTLDPVGTNLVASSNIYDSVLIDVGTGTGSHRSFIFKEPGYGKNGAMDVNELNYFDNGLSIQWDLHDLTGNTADGGSTMAYLMLSDNNNRARYYPGKDNNGLSFSITRKFASSLTNDYYFLEIHRLSDDGATAPQQILKQNLALPSGGSAPVAPTGLNITLDGTGTDVSYSISVSGTTFVGGLTQVSGSITNIVEADYSNFVLAVGAYNSGAVNEGASYVLDAVVTDPLPADTAEVVVHAENWNGALAGWNVYASTAGQQPVATNSIGADTYDGVFFDVGNITNAQRSYMYKEPGYGQNSGMGADELNYFEKPLDIQWDLSELAGDPGSKATSTYLGLFDTNNRNKYYYGKGNNGLVFSINRKYWAGGTNDYYYLEIMHTTSAAGPVRLLKHNFTLPSGTNETDLVAPTGLDIMLDGTGGNVSYSVTVSGTTFAGGDREISGSFTNIVETDYSAFALAIGACNVGVGVVDAPSFITDSIVIEALPISALPFDVIVGPNLIPNGSFGQLSNMTPPGEDKYNVAGSFGDYSGLWGKTADVVGWSPYHADPDGLTGHIGAPYTDDGGLLGGTFYLDTHIASDGELTLNSSMNYRNGMKQENILGQVSPGATYELRVDVAQPNSNTDQSSATFTAALTAGADASNTAQAVAGSLMSIAADTLPDAAGTYQTATISGADLLAAQAPIHVIIDHVNTEAIVDYPGGTPNPTNVTQVSQLKVYEVALVITVPEAGDVNKDGVIDAADLALANTYLAGDGGETATNRQAVLIAQGSTPVEALTALNLTDFDVNGDGYFDAGDVTALEALLVPDPVAVQVEFSAGMLNFVWNSNDGKTYDLESCDNLSFTNWTPHGSHTNMSAAELTNTIIGVSADDPVRFFRIIEK